MTKYVLCPHCQGFVVVLELNCLIFRHGVFKHNFEQIPPHSTKEECDKWSDNEEIYGCGKPFKIRIPNPPIAPPLTVSSDSADSTDSADSAIDEKHVWEELEAEICGYI